MADGKVSPVILMELLRKVPGGSEAIDLLMQNPAASPSDVGQIFRAAHSADWKPATTLSIGKYFRSWARYAGVPTALRQHAMTAPAEQDTLF
jgi:hypothetical protein